MVDRYFTYIFVSLWKCFSFLSFAIIALWLQNWDIKHMFQYYKAGFTKNEYILKEVSCIPNAKLVKIIGMNHLYF